MWLTTNYLDSKLSKVLYFPLALGLCVAYLSKCLFFSGLLANDIYENFALEILSWRWKLYEWHLHPAIVSLWGPQNPVFWKFRTSKKSGHSWTLRPHIKWFQNQLVETFRFWFVCWWYNWLSPHFHPEVVNFHFVNGGKQQRKGLPFWQIDQWI